MTNKKLRNAVMGFLAALGIVSGGVYVAVDTTGPSPAGGDHVLTVRALTWWPQCSRPPSRPNGLVENFRADIAKGDPVAGYYLIAPPVSYGLPDTPAGRAEAGRRSALRARYGDPADPADDIPADVWDALLFAALDLEVPDVCSPTFDVSVETVYAAAETMASLKCLADVAEPCAQVGYSNANEWLNHVKPYGEKPWPADTLAWVADWDGDPSFAGIRLFGGLTPADILIKQYSGNTLYNRAWVDLNSLEVPAELFGPASPPPAPSPTATQPPSVVAVPRDPPDYSPGCWLGWFDPSWLGRFNVCAWAWVDRAGNFYDPGLRQWYFPNGVPMP